MLKKKKKSKKKIKQVSLLVIKIENKKKLIQPSICRTHNAAARN